MLTACLESRCGQHPVFRRYVMFQRSEAQSADKDRENAQTEVSEGRFQEASHASSSAKSTTFVVFTIPSILIHCLIPVIPILTPAPVLIIIRIVMLILALNTTIITITITNTNIMIIISVSIIIRPQHPHRHHPCLCEKPCDDNKIAW